MHVVRAREDFIGKEAALRSYFQEKDKGRLKDYSAIMDSLEKYHHIIEDWKESAEEISIWWEILSTYPNQYWNYPLFVFLHKHGTLHENNFSINEERTKEFLILIKETVRYCFIKGVVHNNVNAIKDAIFKVEKAIDKDKDYLKEYKQDLLKKKQGTSIEGEDGNKNEIEKCEHRLKDSDYGMRYRKGLILIASFLNSDQSAKGYIDMLRGKYDIEHILPRKWCNYDKWDTESHKMYVDMLGNLAPIEKKLNIKASNEFFQKKKEIYKNGNTAKKKKTGQTKVQDLIDLAKIKNWYPEDLKKRHAEMLERLNNFFAN